MTHTESERTAYIAGAIDGEGWIGVCRKGPSARDGKRTPHFSFAVTITNTKREWLETLQSWFGGYLDTVYGLSDRRQATYRLTYRQAEAKALLSRVMPYLLIKYRQAELLMRHFELAATRRAMNGAPKNGANAEIVAQQEALYQEIRALNRRGGRVEARSGGGQRSVRTCEFEGCGKPHLGRGYCRMHYRKFIVRGGPALHELSCKECGKAFVARRSDAAYCSKECTSKAYYRVQGDRIRARVRDYKRRARKSDKDVPVAAVK